MIIDSHQHVILPTDKQIREMDRAGIDKTILFATTPHPERARNLGEFEKEFQLLASVLGGNTSSAERIRTIKQTLHELRATIATRPERFFGFGTAPLFLNPKETADWIDQEIVSTGLKGIGELSPTNGDADRLDSLFQASAENGNLPLWFHTFTPVTSDDIRKIATLAKQFPSVPTIFGHIGGTNWLDTLHMAKEIPNAYLDLSAVYTAYQPYFAMRELPERTLFSSDAPYGSPFLFREMVEELSPSGEVTKLVLGGNIQRLLAQ